MNLILILTYNIILTGLEMIQIMAFGQNLKEKEHQYKSANLLAKTKILQWKKNPDWRK